MTKSSKLLEKVAARRKASRFTLEQATELVTDAKAAELRAGFADHPVRDSMLLRVALTAMPPRPLPGDEWLRLRAVCLFGALDGHALAGLVIGKGSKRPRAFGTAGAATRFCDQALRQATEVLAGPLAEPARALVEHHLKLAPKKHRKLASEAIGKAIALGALVYAFEHELDPLVLGVKPRSRPRAEKSPIEPRHVGLPEEQLAKILAAPQDDAPRLVLADGLIEQGDPRGELIQLQCKLGRGTFGAGARYVDRRAALLGEEERAPLEEREKALFKAHEKRWLEPIRKYVRTWGFRRGFVDRVLCDAKLFFDGLAALAREPIEKAKLTAWTPALNDRIHRAAPHPTLWLLELSENRLEPADLEILASPFCAKLRGLDLWGNPFEDEGAARLRDFAPRTLERLNLTSTGVTGAGLKTLAKTSWWKRLTHLDLGLNGTIGDDGVEALEGCDRLQWVNFMGCDLSDRGAKALAATRLPALKHLCITGPGVRSEGAMALVRSTTTLPALERLDLRHDLDRKVLKAARDRFGPPATAENFYVQHFFY